MNSVWVLEHYRKFDISKGCDTGSKVDLPTSRAQNFHEREARAVDFYVFCGKSERESESSCWGQLPEPEMRGEGL